MRGVLYIKNNLVRRVLPFYLFISILFSCTTDSYDKGEGKYSLIQADFAELNINSEKCGISFLTDEGDEYLLNKPLIASWIETADTIYRTAIYYNKVEEGKVELRSIGIIPTLCPKDAKEFKKLPQDPVGMESAWLTSNSKYINLGLLLKNGRNDAGKEGVHSLALVQDEVRENDDHTHTAYYRLLHLQGEAPEYYTNRHYVCILLPKENRPDSVCLTVKTYDGVVVKKFKL